jgi:putative heme iron utilization protein
MAESFDSIFFVDRPFMGQESLSIQIYDKDGNASIKFYLGRDENRKIKQEQKEKFLELRKRFMQ